MKPVIPQHDAKVQCIHCFVFMAMNRVLIKKKTWILDDHNFLLWVCSIHQKLWFTELGGTTSKFLCKLKIWVLSHKSEISKCKSNGIMNVSLLEITSLEIHELGFHRSRYDCILFLLRALHKSYILWSYTSCNSLHFTTASCVCLKSFVTPSTACLNWLNLDQNDSYYFISVLFHELLEILPSNGKIFSTLG
jgi:hypothetical protein